MKKKNSEKKSGKQTWPEKLKDKHTRAVLASALLILLPLFIFGLSRLQKDPTVTYVPYRSFEKLLQENQVMYVFMQESDSQLQFIPSETWLKSQNIEVGKNWQPFLKDLFELKSTRIERKTLDTLSPRFITENPSSPEFRETLLKSGVRVLSVQPQNNPFAFLIYFLQMFFPFLLLLGFFVYYQQQMDPKEAEILTDIPDTNFSSIAGYTGLKRDSTYILDFLKSPQRYEEMGARLPNGIIFYGPPGTGKTLMARAIAGEAKVPFFKVNGSDFVELYVGMGARRVRRLYKSARKNAPCIVFIDEIDAVGGARGKLSGTSEDDKTLTALLNELDGFSAQEGVITIAATNRLDDLDPALVRPGRFDRQMAIPLPDKKERRAILALYSENKKIDSAVSLDRLCAKTVGFSPSELENLLNEAAIRAVTLSHEKISQQDIDDAYLRILIKGDKKDEPVEFASQKRIIAYHEAGHAIVMYLQGQQVLEVSILPTTTGAGGYTLNEPKEGLLTRHDMKNQVRALYAGRAAETIIAEHEDDITTGAVNDIENATKIIAGIIKTLGMHDSLINLDVLGMSRPNQEYIEKAEQIASALFHETRQMLIANRPALDRLAQHLMEHSVIDPQEFLRIVEHPAAIEPTKTSI